MQRSRKVHLIKLKLTAVTEATKNISIWTLGSIKEFFKQIR